MKDMESLQKLRAREQGAPRQTYHGIFSTHPRNDARLRSAVGQATSDSSTVFRDNGAALYRQLTEGLIWGENFAEKEKKPTRWSNMNLRVRFDFPEGWTHETDAQGLVVTGEPEDNVASLSMQPWPAPPRTPKNTCTTTSMCHNCARAKPYNPPS